MRGFIVAQIRASISIIMAIVKCSIFTSWARQVPSEWQCALRYDDYGPVWPVTAAERAGASPWASLRSTGNCLNWNGQMEGDSSLQIMNYFLKTCNGAQSAHDAINKLQVSKGY